MTKVRMLGATNWDGPRKPGDELDVDDKVAERWQKHNIAEIIEQPKAARGKKAAEPPDDPAM